MKVKFKGKEIVIPKELEEKAKYILRGYFGMDGKQLQELVKDAENIVLDEKCLGKISKLKVEKLKEKLSKLIIFGDK